MADAETKSKTISYRHILYGDKCQPALNDPRQFSRLEPVQCCLGQFPGVKPLSPSLAMNALKNVLSPLPMNTNAIQDSLKLVVIGGTVETARRASVSAWNGFIDSFFLSAHFSQEDYPYDWLMHWLSKQPAWDRSREFEITTLSAGKHGLTESTTGDLEEEDVEDDDDRELVHGRRKRKVAFMPSVDTTHTIYYRGHWLRITRSKKHPDHYGQGGSLKISVVARNNDILKELVLEAKRDYEKDAEHRVHIFMADTTNVCWRWNGARQKRPMSSIVLQPGVKDMIAEINPKNPNNNQLFSNSKNFSIGNGATFTTAGGDIQQNTTNDHSSNTTIYNNCTFSREAGSTPKLSPPSSHRSKRSPDHQKRRRWSITTFVHSVYHHYLQPVVYPIAWAVPAWTTMPLSWVNFLGGDSQSCY
ncbi:BCS1 N terminal-domain-containing protein [Rhodocollybia butyracea]|uniref:BCS1 N terminal-domain-containing protein n=1 Tax=Rhodocollybia butyracea TaxID=206335 RepID=A0A9P5Q2L1_9AGAR|nr:BCS1 N terminal-domain-containing protein [Rhodocollybia butyracea]